MAGSSSHASETFFIEEEGVLVTQVGGRGGGERDPMADAEDDEDRLPEAPEPRDLRDGEAAPFRFVRVGPRGNPLGARATRALAAAMVGGRPGPDGDVPAGYTYLGQFVDHDLTKDVTDVMLGDRIGPADLLQGRSPSLDLDSVYGAGPAEDEALQLFEDDGIHLRVGTTKPEGGLPAFPGHDLPRVASGPDRGRALIGDHRNDENLAVAQTHLAFLRLHNAAVDAQDGPLAAAPSGRRFRRARREVTLHYQWLLRHDYLPRICDPAVLDDVWDSGGRALVQPGAAPDEVPRMPIEFSVAAFRLGHSMVRADYNWNEIFSDGFGSLDLLFSFSGVGGDLGGNPRLVSTWPADWRRIYDFPAAGRANLDAPGRGVDHALRIDTRLVDVLGRLPSSTFGGDDATTPGVQRNLAFRNLVRAAMLRVSTGQGMVERLGEVGVAVTPLTADQILDGRRGADLSGMGPEDRDDLVQRTPLWFYVLREAEVNGGVLTGVGARLVAETFHRAMEGSRVSLVREAGFTPTLGPRPGTFEMTDLLQVAFGTTRSALSPVG